MKRQAIQYCSVLGWILKKKIGATFSKSSNKNPERLLFQTVTCLAMFGHEISDHFLQPSSGWLSTSQIGGCLVWCYFLQMPKTILPNLKKDWYARCGLVFTCFFKISYVMFIIVWNFCFVGFCIAANSSMFHHLSSLSLPGTRKGPVSRDSECGGWKDWQPSALQKTLKFLEDEILIVK